MKLLLFDVDLTLVNSGGAGRRAMMQAFQQLYGKSNGFENISFAGRTDPAIFRDAVERLGLLWQQETEDAFKERYLEILKGEIEKPNSKKHIEPGVQAILPELAQMKNVTLALLTGNWYEGARAKLKHFDLLRFFEFGAFADDSWQRHELPAIAAKRYNEKTSKEISPADVFVIGDTPRDIACAQPFGARTIAVATGLFSHEELQAAGPDYLFHDFSKTTELLAIFEAAQ